MGEMKACYVGTFMKLQITSDRSARMNYGHVCLVVMGCLMAAPANIPSADNVQKRPGCHLQHRRRAFQVQLQTVRLGMAKEQVISRLGRPELIERVTTDGAGTTHDAVLKYGVCAGSRLGTLGHVVLDDKGRVVKVVGHEGCP